ncbi:MmpS family transport accessory protein [Nocardia sp. NPDC058666]|uniref:MmpS family transport accessory protein n=1 Tax=Nocardia sp. NPDC058666 TaxID=3346587 RepID=UPI0036591AAE
MRRVSAIAAVMAAGAVFLSGCSSTGTSSDEITYKVGGTTQASITYTDGGTQTSQETEATIPWEKKISTKSDAILYQISAQNSIPGSDSVTCEILLGDKSVSTNEGKGEFAIASCQYTP